MVLDSGGVSQFARRSPDTAALIAAFRSEGLRPPIVPSAVLIECLTGHSCRDAKTNRLLKTCDVVEQLPEERAHRAAWRRHGRSEGPSGPCRTRPTRDHPRQLTGTPRGCSAGTRSRPPGMPAGSDLRSVLAVSAEVQFPKAGGYELRAELDGKVRTAALRVHQPQPLPAAGIGPASINAPRP